MKVDGNPSWDGVFATQVQICANPVPPAAHRPHRRTRRLLLRPSVVHDALTGMVLLLHGRSIASKRHTECLMAMATQRTPRQAHQVQHRHNPRRTTQTVHWGILGAVLVVGTYVYCAG